MIEDYAKIRAIADLAIGAMGDELTFACPEELEVVKICTTEDIAVLGVDLFEVGSAGYVTKKLSAYSYDLATQEQLESTLSTSGWRDYVKASNALAKEFILQNPAGDDHVYNLTTSSWREFCEVQERKRESTRPPHE